MKLRRRWFVLGVVAAVALVAGPQAFRHARAAGLLTRFAYEQHTGLGAVGAHEVDEQASSFVANGESVPARLFLPRDVSRPPGLVLVHGVHHLGIDEPRLQKFARALASSGLAVFTPQVAELADYRVDARSVDTIGAAVDAFSAQQGGRQVGLMGLSFAGGLSLVAASDPRFIPRLSYVVAVGAHDDLERVSRFFALDEVTYPDGTTKHFAAHEYGLLVLARSHVEQLFEAPDREAARESLRLWLWEDRDGARTKAAELSEPGKAKLTALFEHRLEALRPELSACIERDRATAAAVSPSAHLATLGVPALLLHGAGDNVIPASETLWLEKHVPPDKLAAALVSPALQHVELEGEPGWADQWALVHFIERLLAAAGE